MSRFPNNRQQSQRGKQQPQWRGGVRQMNRQQLEFVPSVSRSSGLDKDGDTLKDRKIQEDYRELIRDELVKLDKVSGKMNTTERKRLEENILIRFRKLREGVFSSKRADSFAVEVSETSLALAVLFGSPQQATTIISHLLPELYLQAPPPHSGLALTVIISLLHHLLNAYPSQRTYLRHLESLPARVLDQRSELVLWISSLASSLRTRNYVRFDTLTQLSTISAMLDEPSRTFSSLSLTSRSSSELQKKAICALVEALRAKSGEAAWAVIRSAYRELSCHEGSESVSWLRKSLCLPVISPEGGVSLTEWMEKKAVGGHVRKKEGAEGRWIVCKLH